MASAAVKTAMLLALLAATAGSCRAGGVDVVVFGDSWGTEGAASFAKMAAAHGLTVHNAAVGGTTTGSWASKPDSLKNAVDAAGGAKHVWLTIGGNDAIDGLIAGGNVHTILEQATSNLQVFLQPLLTAYPSIGVVQFGYDVVNFKIDLCPLLGDGKQALLGADQPVARLTQLCRVRAQLSSGTCAPAAPPTSPATTRSSCRSSSGWRT